MSKIQVTSSLGEVEGGNAQVSPCQCNRFFSLKRVGTSGVSACDMFISSSCCFLSVKLPSPLFGAALVTLGSSSTCSSFAASPFAWSSFVYTSVIGRGYYNFRYTTV